MANNNNMPARLAILALILATAGSAQADVITLTTWNVGDIQASGDLVHITTGSNALETATTVTFQWQEGDTSDSLTSATALDQIYFNTLQALGTYSIVDVLDNGVSDVDNWSFGVGGETSGAGGLFGTFNSRNNKEAPADDGGIEPNTLTFVFSSFITFVPNDTGAMFAAHVRYGDSNCSGWVSNPDAVDPQQIGPGDCGTTTRVLEPGTLSLLGLGILGIGLLRRRRTRR